MSTLGDVAKKGSKAGNWLHGSDLPQKISSVKVKVADVEEAGDSLNCKCIVKLAEPVYDADAWTVNATNLTTLMELTKTTKEDEFETLRKRLVGKTLTLGIVMVNDPQKRKPVRSLQVSALA